VDVTTTVTVLAPFVVRQGQRGVGRSVGLHRPGRCAFAAEFAAVRVLAEVEDAANAVVNLGFLARPTIYLGGAVTSPPALTKTRFGFESGAVQTQQITEKQSGFF
jgi:hypothetical protein